MGLSQRFQDKGFRGPKALLPIELNGERMSCFERIVRSIPRPWSPFVVTHKEARSDFLAVLKKLGRPGEVLGLPNKTEGQSATVLLALRRCTRNTSVIIQNCDVVFDQIVMRVVAGMGANTIAWHKSDNPAFSFINDGKWATRFVEKQPISNKAISGLYKIEKAGDLEDAIERQIRSERRHTNGEFYLSTALEMMEQQFHPFEVDKHEMLDLGTPEAVMDNGGLIVQE